MKPFKMNYKNGRHSPHIQFLCRLSMGLQQAKFQHKLDQYPGPLTLHLGQYHISSFDISSSLVNAFKQSARFMGSSDFFLMNSTESSCLTFFSST
eukprot:m.296188 g.296188  ORF g.296188 m.296188 type:complete len:95 (-) comp16393_c6_seq55:8685-8969(-)